MLPKDTLEKILAVGGQLTTIQQAPGGEHFIVLGNGTVQSLAPMMPPARVKERVALIDAGSFCDYVNRFKNPDTLIFATVTPTGAKLTAIIDYHGAPITPPAHPVCPEPPCSLPYPRYGNHIATLELVETAEWKDWCETDGSDPTMNQEAFATWLEEHQHLFNLEDLPPDTLKGAQLLELVCNLQAHSNVRYNRQIRLQNGGNKFDYEEDVAIAGQVTSGTKQGQMELPGLIHAGIQIYEGGRTYQVDARLKTRISGRSLAIWFETVRKHKLVQDAVLETVKAVTEKTGIIPLIGSVTGK